MKIRKFKDDIKQLGVKDLRIKLDELRRSLFSLRLNSTTSHVKDYSQFGKIRENIARILTELRQKEGVK
jgi:ribosomal protein L29